MIIYKIINIKNVNDYFQLKTCISGTHIDNDVINELAYYIGLKCDKIAVESPYADKDYLSTYYIHYAKKYKTIDKKCYRLHFYNKNNYYGYITLRPTCRRKIGRSYLHPSLLLNQKAYLMTNSYKVNVVGSEVFIDAFPWMHQEPDVSSCAHVSIWAILRYFSNKQSNYPDANMGNVVENVQLNYDRKIPSRGLRVDQISELLIRYGFSTLIRTPTRISDEIYTYIESGLPLIGIVPTEKDDAHAICIIGHGKISDISLSTNDLYEKITYGKEEIVTDIILSTKFINSIIVNDDNLLPYRTVYKKVSMLENYTKYDPKYIVDSITTFIIPLYEKMQITYNEVYNVVMNLLNSDGLKDLPSPKVLRFFITSSNSFKRSLSSRNVCNNLKRILLRLNMPKFIWCVEIFSIENYKNGLVDGCVVVDATDSSEEGYPFIFHHDKKTIKYFNGNRNLVEEFEITPYNLYINNLEEFNNG